MKISFNPSNSNKNILDLIKNNKDIIFDLKGHSIFARGVEFKGTDTNTWRDIKINNVSIGSHTLDLRNGSNTTLTNTNGVVTINSTWRPVVDNLTSDSTTSSLSAKQGKVLKALIDGKSNSDHNHDGRYLKLTGGTMASNALITFADSGSWDTSKKPQGARGGLYWTGQSDYAKLYAEETVGDNLDLVIQFGDDNSNGLSIRNKANTQTSYISSSGVITTGTFKGNLDWSYITNKPATATRWPSWAEVTGKPSSFTPSTHTHGLSNSVFFLNMPSINGNAKWKEVFGYPVNYNLLLSVRINNPAPEWCVGNFGSGILYGGSDTKGFMSSAYNEPFIMWAGGNGSSDDSVPKWYIGIKGTHKSIYNLATIASEANAAYNLRHSHANKSVLDGITSALVNSWNTAYNFVSNITGTDTDKVINKWEEIVNFLAGITEDNKLNTLLNSKLSIQQLSAKDILTTKTNNALFWVDTKGNASTITTGPFTDHPYALLSVTNYNQNAENHKFFYRSRLAFSSAGDIKVASCHHEYEYQQDETWYNVLTSKNSGINGSTIKLNGTSITVYSSGTADGRYVKKSGDTMSGVLTIDTTNFGALTIKRNDDANGASIQFRGKSSVYGYIGLNNSTKDKQFLRWSSDTSRIYTILDTSSTYISNGKGVINGTTITQVDNATNSTNSTNARKLVNWYSARPTSLNAQFGDGSLRIFYATSSTTEGKPAEDSHILHLAWDNTGGYDAQLAVHIRSGKVSTRAQNDGTWQPWKTLAFANEIPTSLKNPYALTISLNGTSQGPYDGSAAKNINITPGSIGAAVSNHSHDYLVVNSADDKSFNSAYHNFQVLYAGGGNGITGKPANVDAFGLFKFRAANGCSGQMLLANGGSLYIRSSEDAKMTNTLAWKTILDSSNYSGILDSRYYTESEVNSLLDAKLNRQNLSYGNWNPRGWNLAADYHYNGGDLSISENNGKMYISVDGCFWQNEGQYRVLDTSDIGDIRSSVTLHQYLSATDAAWYPLVWGGNSHNNTSDSTGAVYKSYDKLSWQTSSQTLYTTHLRTTDITFPNSGTSMRGIQGTVGDTDAWRIKGGATASNSGYLEIATAGDGNEPIYVRQYTGAFSTIKRTLTLLDTNGFAHFPSYINIGGNENNNSSPDRVWGSNSSDSYLRSYRTSALRVAYAVNANSATTASSANKLTTARNIALGMDLRGSANFDGSGNITINANINACTIGVGSTNGLPFKRIAHFETGGSWNDNALLLYISQGYINGRNGICRVEFRTDNISSSSTSTTASAAVRWLVRNGYGLDSLYAGYYATAGKAYIDIYLKTTSGYQGTVIRVLQDSRGGINSNVQLINSYYYSDTNHKEAYNSIEAASTALYNRAYTRIVSGSDIGTVSYSNSTGSVHWNNVTNKPSTFNPAAHTHTVFKNNLMIKGTNGISDSASIHLGIGDSDTGFKWISDGVCQIYANNAAVGQWTSGGMDWFKNPTVNGNKVWNAGNDGSGSGLDADTLDGYHAASFVKMKQFRFNQYEKGFWTKILTITINSTSDLQPVIAFNWIPSECAREVWAEFTINWRSNSPIFYAIWKGTAVRTLTCVNSSGNIWNVWVQGDKNSYDPFGEVQVTYAHNISSYNGGSLGYSDSDPGGTRCTLGGYVNYARSTGNADTVDGQHASAFSYKSWWHWYGKDGQPNWLWGGNNENDYYVYNPSNFRVAYAASAGNADTLDGYPANGSNDRPYGHIPTIESDGVMKVGRYIDFHNDNNGKHDFSTRLQSTGNYGNEVNLPSASGTLALINDVNNYYWANVKISTSSSTTTSPTFSNVYLGNSLYLNNRGLNSIYNGPIDSANGVGGPLNNLVFSSWYGVSFTTSCAGFTYTNKNAVSINCRTGQLYAREVQANGFMHTGHNNNDAVLLAGGGYKTLKDFIFLNKYNYTDHEHYNLAFYKLSGICNNLVWVDGHVKGSIAKSFVIDPAVFPYCYDEDPNLNTIYLMSGKNYITINAIGVVTINNATDHKQRVGFFYVGRD